MADFPSNFKKLEESLFNAEFQKSKLEEEEIEKLKQYKHRLINELKILLIKNKAKRKK